jgi:hypothetical protein
VLAPLAFGTVVRPATGASTVVINEGTGNVTTTGGAVSIGNGQSRAAFNVSGEGGQVYNITLANSQITLNRTTPSGGGSMTVDLVRSKTQGTLTGQLGATGTDSFHVGGTLNIASEQATGTYTGTLNAIVTYQ